VVAENPETLRKNMHEYPIFKHLVQFSNLVDEGGVLMTQPVLT